MKANAPTVQALKIAIIDDEKAARTALARLLRSEEIDASTFSSAAEFLADPVRAEFDCVVSDVRMPDVDGIELQAELNRSLSHISIVFISGRGNVPMSVEAMKGGAVDFLEKPVRRDALLGAVNRASERSRALRIAGADLQSLRKRYASLTPREQQVFELVTTGLLNKQVGFQLGAAEKTVKIHRAHVMEKMQAHSLADLVRMAQRLGMRSEVPESFRPAARRS